jgi:16S rRNA A1518/A1519 N6-dimethyltransferase RsmA/KsgA/DIM1 with predicted DNA glycosylase/AP lyase activity
MLQWRYQMEMMFIVPPTAFNPAPKVDSAIVRMRPLASPLSCEQTKLEQVVTQAFSQRRKVIRNSLGGLFSEQQLIDAGIDPQARPETIALAQYVALTQPAAIPQPGNSSFSEHAIHHEHPAPSNRPSKHAQQVRGQMHVNCFF